MIFHLAEPHDWDARTDSYTAPSLHTDGFIHLSTRDQLDRTAATVFPGRTDLLLLTVDENLVPGGVVYEDLYGSGEGFPHIYGPIPIAAVVAVDAYVPPSGSDRYTHGHHESVLASHRHRSAEDSAQYLLPHLQAGVRLLDIGCGPGTITTDLAAIVAPGEAVAIDREPKMVDETQQRANELGLTNLTAEVGDVMTLPYPDDSFDVTHTHQALHHLSDPVAAVREMRRVTRPGGLVTCREADYSATTWYPADARLDRWRDIYLTVARSNGDEPDAGRRLLAWAHEAGFTEVEASASVWCFADDNTRS